MNNQVPNPDSFSTIPRVIFLKILLEMDDLMQIQICRRVSKKWKKNIDESETFKELKRLAILLSKCKR